MSSPPPLPPPTPHVVPVPAPPSRFAWLGHPLVIVMIAGGALVAGIVGATLLYLLTARDFTPTASQDACILKAHAIANYFVFPVNSASEELTCERYFDRSLYLDYYYDDPHPDAPYLNCSLTIERKHSDALISFASEWQSFKTGMALPTGVVVDVVPANHVFKWGDASRFAYLEIGGRRYGMAFIARKGKKIFFLSSQGSWLDDPAEVDDLLRPYLERFEREPF